MGRGQGANHGVRSGGLVGRLRRQLRHTSSATPPAGVHFINNREELEALLGKAFTEPAHTDYQQTSSRLWQAGYQAFLEGDQQAALSAWMQIAADEHLAQGDALLGLHRFAPDNLEVSEALYQHRDSIGHLQDEFDAPLSSTVRPLGLAARPLISADDAAIAYAINLAHHMRFDDAEAVLAANPQVESRLRQGAAARLAYERCDYEQALQLAQSLVDDPDFGDESQLLIGASEIRLGHLDRAVTALETVREHEEAHITSRTLSALLLGQIHAQHEETSEVQQLVQETTSEVQPDTLMEASKLAAELSLHPNEFRAADHLSTEENAAWRASVQALEANHVITDANILDNQASTDDSDPATD